MNTQSGGEPVGLDGGPLGTLDFHWDQDRYRHSWRFPNHDLQLASVESDSSQVWPVSPPLQQIHQQSFGDGREVVFGVGMSGRGHWSASFTLVPDLSSWIVEFACRSPVDPECLLSTYEANRAPQANSEMQFGFLDVPGIVMEAVAPGTLASQEDQRLAFSPAQLTSGDVTCQWALRLRVTQ